MPSLVFSTVFFRVGSRASIFSPSFASISAICFWSRSKSFASDPVTDCFSILWRKSCKPAHTSSASSSYFRRSLPAFASIRVKAGKLLRKYELEAEEVWAGLQDLRHKMEKQSVTGSLAKDFERDQKQIAEMLAKLGEKIEALDPTLKNTVEKTREGIEFHLDKLRRKAGTALDQKAGLLTAHEQHLEALLNPHKVLQERELCLLPFLARWGAGGLGELQKLSSGKKIGHHFILQLP